MNEILEGVANLAAVLSIALIVWGGVLALGYALGSSLAGGRQLLLRRVAVGAITLALGVLLVAPGRAAAEEDYRRAMEAAEARDYADAAGWLRSAAERGDVRAQERLGMLLVFGERLYGAEVRGDASEGRAWLERAAAQGSETARQILARGGEASPTLVASK